MANTIPCPNPVCTHEFGLAELQSAAQLLCPKCGFRMEGRGPAKPAAPKPAVAQPIAVKVALATAAPPEPAASAPVSTPIADGEGSLSDGTFFNPDVGAGAGTLVRTSAPPRKFSWMRLL